MAETKVGENYISELSRSSVERLYSYYLLAQYAQEHGATHISSRQLAEHLLIGDTQVRKDMAAISLVGQPKRGYDIEGTIQALRGAMGLDQVQHAVLCGVGNLGQALLQYSRFSEFGFKVVGAFDVRPELIGTDIASTRILHIDHLEQVIEIFSVEIGILTVSVWAAQEICDRMVKSGVRAIWNFAPLHLQTPSDVLVRNEDFAGSLTVISHYLHAKPDVPEQEQPAEPE
jgi:redox-sensing transcriptional repressor